MISVIIKEIHLRKKISEFEKNIFKQFLKDEANFKIRFEGFSSKFYQDFVIDNISVEPHNDLDFSVKNVHQEFNKFIKQKSVNELRLILSFLTLQTQID